MEVGLHADNKEAHVKSWTPFQSSNLAMEWPPLDFSSYTHFPQANDAIFIAANNPPTIWADTDTPDTTFVMCKPQRPVIREWFEAARAG